MHPRFLILTAVALWGFSSPIAKYALTYLPSQLLLTYRFGLIVLILTIPILLIRKHLNSINWLKLTLMGLFGTFGQIGLIYLGFNYTTSVEGTLLISSSPIFVACASVLFLKEKITKNELIGYLLGTAGTLVLLVGPLTFSLGNFLILLGNCCWAAFIILNKRFTPKPISSIFITWYMFLIGFIGMLITTLLTLTPSTIINHLTLLPISAHLSVFYLAAGAGIVAYLCYQSALKTIPAAEAELYNYLTPLFATPLAFFWLSENISLPFILSAFLICIGLILAEFLPYYRQNQQKRSRHHSVRRR